jgi:hypothetical protein
MKVRTKAPTSWALKTRRTKPDELKIHVKDVNFKRSKGSLLFTYTVSQDKFPKKLREFQPWEYLKASSDEKLNTHEQSALQSVFHTCSVLREQRMYATKSMARGSRVWRKILYTFKHELNIIERIRKWYEVPFYYLKVRYLKYCINEIKQCRHKVFTLFGFSYADLRMETGEPMPKARFLRSWNTKELLFREDRESMISERAHSVTEWAHTHKDLIPASKPPASRTRRRPRG